MSDGTDLSGIITVSGENHFFDRRGLLTDLHQQDAVEAHVQESCYELRGVSN